MDYSMPHTSRLQQHGSSVFILLLLVTLARFSIDFGFSLKPYMIFLLLFMTIHVSTFYLERLQLFEIVLILFYIMYCFSGIFALYPSSSLRILLGISLYLVCYFITKSMIGNSSQTMIVKAIAYVGIIFNSLSLLLYIVGLKAVDFDLSGERTTEFGVLIDRGYPRLIGLLQDPNFYVYYNTIFFAYFLCNPHSFRNKIGLILCSLTTLLTFSRGGLLAIVVMLAIYICLNKPSKQLKIIVGLCASIFVISAISISYLNIDLYGMMGSRVDDFSIDGGSGRFQLWERAWEFFTNHIVIGIGAFNFSDYNSFKYGDTLSVHNTFLDILSESGLIGFTIFLLFLLTVMHHMLRHQVYRQEPYLFVTFAGFIIQMISLSVILNDMFLLYLAILAAYLQEKDNEKLTSKDGVML